MKLRAVLVCLSFLLSCCLTLNPARAAPQPTDPELNRVIVGFWNNTSAYATYLSSKYQVPKILEDEMFQFAEFLPSDSGKFISTVKALGFVRYAQSSVQGCVMFISDCGSGGGGGGGGGGGCTNCPYFLIGASPSTTTPSSNTPAQSTLTVGSMNGFAGTVSLTASVWQNNGCSQSLTSYNCPIATISPSSVTLSSSSLYGTATLTASISNTTPVGGYTVDVLGSGGGLTYHTYLQISVSYPDDPYYPSQWGPADLNLPAAWQLTRGNKNIVVAVLDTGIRLDHEDLKANLWTAHGFADVPDGSHGVDLAYQTFTPDDTYGHGTAVAGVISAVTNNGLGIAGTAQEQLMAVKVCFNDGRCDIGAEAAGVKWAVNHGANVINMSFGSIPTNSSGSSILGSAVTYAWNHNVLLVAASGDAQNPFCVQGQVDYPAAYPEVIAVSALQAGDTLWPSSCTGPKVELSAPGSSIWTTTSPQNTLPSCARQTYCQFEGTSLASPFVSGIAALAMDYYMQLGQGTISNQILRQALDNYAVDLGSSGRDDSFGYGKPDAKTVLLGLGPQPYALKASWQYGSSGGPETNAHVSVKDLNTGAWLANYQVVYPGLTVYAVPGHVMQVYFERYLSGSSGLYEYDDHVTGDHGAPSYSGLSQTGCPQGFIFPALPGPVVTLDLATYYVTFNGDPYSGIQC